MNQIGNSAMDLPFQVSLIRVFLSVNAVFSLPGDHEIAASSEHNTVASADHRVLKIFCSFVMEHGCVWDECVFWYCIDLLLAYSSLVFDCDAFVSRLSKGNAISLSVFTRGKFGCWWFFVFWCFFFFVWYQIHNEIFCKDAVDSKQNWK